MDLFDRFLQERTYLKGVSPETLRYYRWVRRAFEPILAQPTKEGMLETIQKLLANGISKTSVNTYLRGFKAYIRWLHEEGLLEKIFKVQFLKAEQKVLATFSPAQVQALIKFKPKGLNQTRVHTLTCLLLDSGLRINEARTLQPANLDSDNLIITVMGKGSKQRKIPMSIELRKVLYRYTRDRDWRYVFGTGRQTLCTARNLQRDFVAIARQLGITGVRLSFHTLRHTFAVNYLRAGGNLFYLSKILGHSSITTTQKYLQSLGIEDLQAVHNKLSMLGKS